MHPHFWEYLTIWLLYLLACCVEARYLTKRHPESPVGARLMSALCWPLIFVIAAGLFVYYWTTGQRPVSRAR